MLITCRILVGSARLCRFACRRMMSTSSNIKHQTSAFRHQPSDISHLTSSLLHLPPSAFRPQPSAFLHLPSYIFRPQTSAFRHQTSSIGARHSPVPFCTPERKNHEHLIEQQKISNSRGFHL